ncbi:hypothetical protein [Nonomuraea sp. NPDC048826]|uniref:hypothetical protein n=1 Tax=Nonomuraea sp. NPDC048826 TaxID=3364347 RepID=UPI00371BB903
MMMIGFVMLGVGLLVGVLLALTDPVLLSRVNGEHAQGASGRYLDQDRVVPLPRRESGVREHTAA